MLPFVIELMTMVLSHFNLMKLCEHQSRSIDCRGLVLCHVVFVYQVSERHDEDLLVVVTDHLWLYWLYCHVKCNSPGEASDVL